MVCAHGLARISVFALVLVLSSHRSAHHTQSNMHTTHTLRYVRVHIQPLHTTHCTRCSRTRIHADKHVHSHNHGTCIGYGHALVRIPLARACLRILTPVHTHAHHTRTTLAPHAHHKHKTRMQCDRSDTHSYTSPTPVAQFRMLSDTQSPSFALCSHLHACSKHRTHMHNAHKAAACTHEHEGQAKFSH